MEKVIKNYVEKINKGIVIYDYLTNEVSNKEPIDIYNDGRIQGFRFYDKEFIIDGKKYFEGKPYNYSNWYFYGKRMDIEEVEKAYMLNAKYSRLIGYIKSKGFKYVCHTQTGDFFPMENDDMTFNEYIEKNHAHSLKLTKNK